MKIILWIVIILIIITGGFLIFNTGAPDDVEQAIVNDVAAKDDMASTTSDFQIENLQEKIDSLDPSAIDLMFTGYGPGKSHEGKFEKYSVKDITVENDMITGGVIVFDLTSVSTGIDKLNSHLCTDEFFGCEAHPEATFTFGSAKRIDNTTLEVSGKFEMKGVSKNITFNVKQQDNVYTADFLLNTSEFDFNVALADSDVRINFTITLPEVEAMEEKEEADLME